MVCTRPVRHVHPLWLNDAGEIPFKDAGGSAAWDEVTPGLEDPALTLPVVKPDVVVPVVELFLE